MINLNNSNLATFNMQSAPLSTPSQSAYATGAPLSSNPSSANSSAVASIGNHSLFGRLISLIETQRTEIEKLNLLPTIILNGERYFTTGNSLFDNATIRCFAEIHNQEAIKRQKWAFFDVYCRPNDVLLLEGAPAGQEVDPMLLIDTTAQRVISRVSSYGWEPHEWLDNLHFTLKSKLNIYLCALKETNQIDIVDFCLQNGFKDLFAIIAQIRSDFVDLLRATANAHIPEVRREKENDLRALVFAALHELEEANHQLFCEAERRFFPLRNREFIQRLEQHEGHMRYIVGGLDHFPTPLSENDSNLDETRNYLASKKYCVLIPKRVCAVFEGHIHKDICMICETVDRVDTDFLPTELAVDTVYSNCALFLRLAKLHFALDQQMPSSKAVAQLYLQVVFNTANVSQFGSRFLELCELIEPSRIRNSGLGASSRQYLENLYHFIAPIYAAAIR